MCPDNSTAHFAPAEIESAVRSYWEFIAAKKTNQWQAFFSESATIFATGSKRAEPARLVLLRREREYFAGATKLRVSVGKIDVELIGRDCAVAAYLVQFDAEHIAKLSAAGNKVREEHLDNARVTQVFQRKGDGGLKIVHEHISLAEE